MKAKAIIYQTNTGHTRAYAEILSKKLGIPCFDISESSGSVPKGETIIYMGWLKAGKIKGYSKAARRYSIEAICPVGMIDDKNQRDDVIKSNRTGNTPVFILKGGLELEKLKGLDKLSIKIMTDGIINGLSEKKNRTPEENALLEIAARGGSRVSEENLSEVIKWAGR